MNETAIYLNGWAAAALATVLRELVPHGGDGIDGVTIEQVGINWQVTVNTDGPARRAIIGPTGHVEFVDSFV